MRRFHAESVSLDSKMFLSCKDCSFYSPITTTTKKKGACCLLPLPALLSHPNPPAPARSHPRSQLHPPAGLRHGRSASPCTLPRQKTRTLSTSASLWCFRSQPRWGPYLTAAKGGRGQSRVGCVSSNLWFSPTSIPMRCHRSLFVTPEDSQMNRSTSKQAVRAGKLRMQLSLGREGSKPNVWFAFFLQDCTGPGPRGQGWAGDCHALWAHRGKRSSSLGDVLPFKGSLGLESWVCLCSSNQSLFW